MKPTPLDPKLVEQAILNATAETQSVLAVFKMVYPDWDSIESVDGYPVCNERTWKAICQFSIALSDRLNLDRPRDKQVMPGGAWMNYGFSCRTDEAKALPDWRVIPAPVKLKAKEQAA